MELQNFPFDIQDVSVTLISKIKNETVQFSPKEFRLNKNAKFTFLEQQRYELLDLVEISHVASYDFGSTKMLNAIKSLKLSDVPAERVSAPRLCVKCFVVRRPIYYILNAYLLVFLITITALCFFSISCKLPQNRLQSTGTTLLTSISFKWVTNRVVPTVSYTTSLDRYSLIHIVFLISLLFWHSIIGSFWDDVQGAESIDFYILIAFACVLLLIQLCFLTSFIRAYCKIRTLKKRETNQLVKSSSIGNLTTVF
jgi:hypothetical protein